MASRIDTERKNAKVSAILLRLAEIHDSRELLIGMLDESNLDLLILALGLGKVELRADDAA